MPYIGIGVGLASTWMGGGVLPDGTILGWRYDDMDNFYVGSISRGSVGLTGGLFTDADDFYTGLVIRQLLLTGTQYSDGDTFYAGAISNAAPQTPTVTWDSDEYDLSPAMTITLPPSPFEGEELSWRWANGTNFADLYDSGTHTVTALEAAGTPIVLADASDLIAGQFSFDIMRTFGGISSARSVAVTKTMLTGAQTLSGALYTESADTFYAGTVVRLLQTLSGSLHTDGDTFYGSTVANVGGATYVAPAWKGYDLNARGGAATAFTGADIDIGTADARRLILLMGGYGTSAMTSISGQGKSGSGGSNVGSAVTFNKLAESSGTSNFCSLWYALVPSGTHLALSYTPAGTENNVQFQVVSAYNVAGDAPVLVGSRGYGGTATAFTVDLSGGKEAIAAIYSSTSGTITYTGLTQVREDISGSRRNVYAHTTSSATTSVNFVNGNGVGGVVATVGP